MLFGFQSFPIPKGAFRSVSSVGTFAKERGMPRFAIRLFSLFCFAGPTTVGQARPRTPATTVLERDSPSQIVGRKPMILENPVDRCRFQHFYLREVRLYFDNFGQGDFESLS